MNGQDRVVRGFPVRLLGVELTPEEWAMPMDEFVDSVCDGGLSWVAFRNGDLSIEGHIDPQARLKLAVRWLHEAGLFRREYVELLRAIAPDYRELAERGGDEMVLLTELADRLDQVLPP